MMKRIVASILILLVRYIGLPLLYAVIYSCYYYGKIKSWVRKSGKDDEEF